MVRKKKKGKALRYQAHNPKEPSKWPHFCTLTIMFRDNSTNIVINMFLFSQQIRFFCVICRNNLPHSEILAHSFALPSFTGNSLLDESGQMLNMLWQDNRYEFLRP